MSDQVEKLSIIIDYDGARLSNGVKLNAEELRKLGTSLNQTARDMEKAGDATADAGEKAEKAGSNFEKLGRELGSGDWRGAAVEAGKLAVGTEAVSSSFLLIAGSVGVAVGALGGYLAVMYQVQLETQRQADALLLTGNYAGLVAGQLNDMARTAAAGINGNVGNVRGTMEALTASGRVTTQSLTEVAQAVELVTRFSGQARERVVGDFAGMADGVAKWAAEHNKAYHFLTFEQYKYIESLELAGSTQEAMRVTSEALNRHLGGDLTKNLGYLQTAWKGVGDWASWAWDKMLNVGREDTVVDKLAALRERLDKEVNPVAVAGRTAKPANQGLVERLRSEIADLEETAKLERRAADKKSREAQDAEAAIAADRETKKGAGRAGRAARVDPEIEARRRVVAELAGLSGSFAGDWERLNYLFDAGTLSLEELTKAQADLLAKQPLMRSAAQEEAKAQREATKNREDAIAAASRDYQAHEKEIDGLLKGNEALQLQIESVGKTKGEINALKAARLDHAIALERERLAQLSNFEGAEAARAQIERQIAAMERQRDLTANLGQAEVADEVRKKNETESKRYSDDLRRDIGSALERAFESGKSPAEALADTLSNTVQSRLMAAIAEAMAGAVLKPAEQALGGSLNGVFSGLFSSLFGGGDVIPMQAGGGYHTGGMVGAEPTFTRAVNPAIFSNAARRHSGGLVDGEVPIIAKKGEGVFTRGQMAALAPVGSGGAQEVTVNVYPTEGQTATVTQKQTSSGISIDVMLRQVSEAMAGEVSAGSGPLARAMEGRYGLRTAVN